MIPTIHVGYYSDVWRFGPDVCLCHQSRNSVPMAVVSEKELQERHGEIPQLVPRIQRGPNDVLHADSNPEMDKDPLWTGKQIICQLWIMLVGRTPPHRVLTYRSSCINYNFFCTGWDSGYNCCLHLPWLGSPRNQQLIWNQNEQPTCQTLLNFHFGKTPLEPLPASAKH